MTLVFQLIVERGKEREREGRREREEREGLRW
jgi:hypothetical protein